MHLPSSSDLRVTCVLALPPNNSLMLTQLAAENAVVPCLRRYPRVNGVVSLSRRAA